MALLPRRLLRASRLLFYLSGVLLAASLVAAVAALAAATEIAELLLERIRDELDPATLAGLPPDFLTPASVRSAALALTAACLVLGLGQLATAIGLRRAVRWSYAAAVVGGLFLAATAGASAIFMVVAVPAQPQAAVVLGPGAAILGVISVLYAAIAAWVAAGRRELDAARESSPIPVDDPPIA